METSIKKGEYAEQTPEQKQYKQTKDRFRSEIKSLVDLQKRTKDNRKVVTKDERVYDQNTAQSAATNNAFSLRHHYIAYALFRGKKVPETPKHAPADQSHRAKQYFKENGRNEWGFRPYNEDVVKKLTEKYANAGITTVHYNS